MRTPPHDAAVIGGGIVGLAIAREMQRQGRRGLRRVAVLEKEFRLASHQTGRNSGVLHSGVYYPPGSLRARNCRRGVGLLLRFCDEHGIRYRLCGKLILATASGPETEALEALLERGTENGVPDLRILERRDLRKVEPHAEGAAALHVPSSGIVRFAEVARTLGTLVAEAGGDIRTGSRVVGIDADGPVMRIVDADGEAVRTRILVNCAGLHADRTARLAGDAPGLLVVPFRGEYHRLIAARRHLVRGLLYSVPDPRFPFLGVHLHRNMEGEVHAGPNAVLAFAREGYRWGDANRRDLLEMASHAGMRRFLRREWRAGAVEIRRSLSKRRFARSLARLVPEIRPADLEPAPAGVRAIAMLPDGRIADDFRIRRCGNRIHLLNAPSPAATAAFAIAEQVAEMAAGL